MNEIVLFDLGQFKREMQNRVDHFMRNRCTDKAIAYDSACEYALMCVLHLYGSIEASQINLLKMFQSDLKTAVEYDADTAKDGAE